MQLTRALLAIDPVSAALMPSGAPAGRPAAVVLAQLLLAVPFHLPATPLTVPYARGTAARSLSGGAQALMVAATAAALLAGAALWRLLSQRRVYLVDFSVYRAPDRCGPRAAYTPQQQLCLRMRLAHGCKPLRMRAHVRTPACTVRAAGLADHAARFHGACLMHRACMNLVLAAALRGQGACMLTTACTPHALPPQLEGQQEGV